MGLDMYLHREISWPLFDLDDSDRGGYFSKGRKAAEAVLKAAGERPLMIGASVHLQVPAAYWRKVNSVHAWFVRELADGVDECQDIYVSRADLERLVDTCKRVLADHRLATDELAPQSGFFFGSTEVDEYYFGDLKDTVEMLTAAIEVAEEAGDEHPTWIYRASW